jgi:hypothetical protein
VGGLEGGGIGECAMVVARAGGHVHAGGSTVSSAGAWARVAFG